MRNKTKIFNVEIWTGSKFYVRKIGVVAAMFQTNMQNPVNDNPGGIEHLAGEKTDE